jgi:hypothetical protein
LVAHVSSTLANAFPAVQRQLLECTKWRASFPVNQQHSAAVERLLGIGMLSTPFGAAHKCVRLARHACQLMKATAKGKMHSLPRAIQRTEALYCFLENTARTHHIVDATKEDKEFAPVTQAAAALRTDDGSESSAKRAMMWQAESRLEEGANSSSGVHNDSSSQREDTATAGEEDDDDDDDDADLSDEDEGGGFRLVTKKRKAKGDAAAVNGKSIRAEKDESGEEEEEKPYTIVVTKPKPRHDPAKAVANRSDK